MAGITGYPELSSCDGDLSGLILQDCLLVADLRTDKGATLAAKLALSFDFELVSDFPHRWRTGETNPLQQEEHTANSVAIGCMAWHTGIL
jgi:hypothetical protein